MKITEKHHKWIAGSTPVEGTSSTEIAYWIYGAEEAIKKFGGIPWNKYPDTKPASPGRYLVLLKPEYSLFEYERNSDILYTGPEIDEWDGTGISVTLWQGVLWWAEINLPNK